MPWATVVWRVKRVIRNTFVATSVSLTVACVIVALGLLDDTLNAQREAMQLGTIMVLLLGMYTTWPINLSFGRKCLLFLAEIALAIFAYTAISHIVKGDPTSASVYMPILLIVGAYTALALLIMGVADLSSQSSQKSPSP